MIDVWVLRWLVSEATLYTLATDDDVALQRFLIEDPFAVHVHFVTLLLCENVNKFKAGTDPIAVAAINQLIDSSIEAAKLRKLPI